MFSSTLKLIRNYYHNNINIILSRNTENPNLLKKI